MELTLIETKFYHYQGLYYAVKGDKLIQFDHDHWLDFMPGNEVYGSFMRRFSKMKPIAESEAKEVLKKLKDSINEMME